MFFYHILRRGTLMRIARRLFVVPLANNDHGKTTIIKALVSQGGDPQFDRLRKAPRLLTGPRGRLIDTYIFGRSYQETEKAQRGSVATHSGENGSS
jgi:hypothetical protein